MSLCEWKKSKQQHDRTEGIPGESFFLGTGKLSIFLNFQAAQIKYGVDVKYQRWKWLNLPSSLWILNMIWLNLFWQFADEIADESFVVCFLEGKDLKL